jgi:deltex
VRSGGRPLRCSRAPKKVQKSGALRPQDAREGLARAHAHRGARNAMNWEWEDPATGKWHRYSPRHSASLSAAFQRGDPFETLDGRAPSVSFDAIHALQTNTATKTALPVRRVQAIPPLWEARLGPAHWVAYAGDACAQIEAAWRACAAAGTVGTPAAFLDILLSFGGGYGGMYRVAFQLADGVQEGRRGVLRCVRRTAVPLAAEDAAAGSRAAGPAAAAADGTGAGPAAATVPGRVFQPVEELAERCSICLDEDARQDGGFVVLSACRHGFHLRCIRTHFDTRPTCPICSKSYGVRTGNQPPGTMRVTFLPRGGTPVAGYEDDGTILIHYSLRSGTQGPEHPSPGVPFAGARRVAYLPDVAEGREVLRLLRISFERKLTFTVGRSVTSGRENCVTWSSVHHKTSANGGLLSFGWPDPEYFGRVTSELAALGVL